MKKVVRYAAALSLALGCSWSAELSDGQIQAAIDYGRHHGLMSVAGKGDLVGIAPTIKIQSSNNRLAAAGGRQEICVLSDFARIVVATAAKVRDSGKHGAARFDVPFSVQDARASAVRFGVVTVILKTSFSSTSFRESSRNAHEAQLANWSGSSAHMELKADNKTLSPMTNAQYFSGWPNNQPATNSKAWRVSDYAMPVCEMGHMCGVAEFVFPVTPGGMGLTVVLVGGDGTRIEKEIDPKMAEYFQ
jgi:hypothetical protein